MSKDEEVLSAINAIFQDDFYWKNLEQEGIGKEEEQVIDTDAIMTKINEGEEIKPRELYEEIGKTEDGTIVYKINNVYDEENYGLYKAERPDGTIVEGLPDKFKETEREIIEEKEKEIIDKYPPHSYDKAEVNVINNRIVIALIDTKTAAEMGIKPEILPVNPSEWNKYEVLNKLGVCSITVDSKSLSDKKLPDSYVTNGALTEEGKQKVIQALVSSGQFRKLQQDLAEKKIEHFKTNAAIHNFVETATHIGYLKESDISKSQQIPDARVNDIAKANIVMTRMASMPIVLEIVKDKLLEKEDNTEAKAIIERLGNIEKIIDTLDLGEKIEIITGLRDDLSKISRYISSAVKEIGQEGFSAQGIESKDNNIIITKEMLNKKGNSVLPRILSSISPAVYIKDGKLEIPDIGKERITPEKMEDMAKTISDARGSGDRTAIEKAYNETCIEISTSKMLQQETANDKKEDKIEQNKQPIDNNETVKGNRMETGKREVDDDDDEEIYNPATGQYESKAGAKLTPGKLALGAGMVAMAPLLLLFGPGAMAIGLPILLGAGVLRGVKEYVDKQKKDKVEKQPEKVEKQPEKPKGPSFVERLSNKIHSFGEKIENTRNGEYQNKVDKSDVKDGIFKPALDRAIITDATNSRHPNIEKASGGFHKMNDTVGKVFDKFSAPFNRVDITETKTYLDRSDIRAKDELKNEIGLRGETVSSAFGKIASLRGLIGKSLTTAAASIGVINLDKGSAKRFFDNKDTKFTLGDFVKSSFSLLGKISLGTIIAERRLDISGKVQGGNIENLKETINDVKRGNVGASEVANDVINKSKEQANKALDEQIDKYTQSGDNEKLDKALEQKFDREKNIDKRIEILDRRLEITDNKLEVLELKGRELNIKADILKESLSEKEYKNTIDKIKENEHEIKELGKQDLKNDIEKAEDSDEKKDLLGRIKDKDEIKSVKEAYEKEGVKGALKEAIAIDQKNRNLKIEENKEKIADIDKKIESSENKEDLIKEKEVLEKENASLEKENLIDEIKSNSDDKADELIDKLKEGDYTSEEIEEIKKTYEDGGVDEALNIAKNEYDDATKDGKESTLEDSNEKNEQKKDAVAVASSEDIASSEAFITDIKEGIKKEEIDAEKGEQLIEALKAGEYTQEEIEDIRKSFEEGGVDGALEAVKGIDTENADNASNDKDPTEETGKKAEDKQDNEVAQENGATDEPTNKTIQNTDKAETDKVENEDTITQETDTVEDKVDIDNASQVMEDFQAADDKEKYVDFIAAQLVTEDGEFDKDRFTALTDDLKGLEGVPLSDKEELLDAVIDNSSLSNDEKKSVKEELHEEFSPTENYKNIETLVDSTGNYILEDISDYIPTLCCLVEDDSDKAIEIEFGAMLNSIEANTDAIIEYTVKDSYVEPVNADIEITQAVIEEPVKVDIPEAKEAEKVADYSTQDTYKDATDTGYNPDIPTVDQSYQDDYNHVENFQGPEQNIDSLSGIDFMPKE